MWYNFLITEWQVMAMRGMKLWVVAVFVLIIYGCSGHGGNPVMPDDDGGSDEPALTTFSQDYSGNRYILELGTINVSSDHRTMEVVPLRSGEMHLNLVNFLEKSGYEGLKIIDVALVHPDKMKVDLKFTHPFKYTDISGLCVFDLRCVLMTDSDYEFTSCGRRIAWSGNFPVVLNPDGYTSIFNPTEYPEFSGPPLLTYVAGKYSFGELPDSTLNPFIAYKRERDRRCFSPSSMFNTPHETRDAWLTAPEGPFSFGYAIDCSWMFDGETYPPDANCLEPYDIKTWLALGLTNTPGSEAALHVEVFDHQELESIEAVSLEAPDLFEGTITLTYSNVMSEESVLFEGVVSNVLGADDGEYPLLIRAVSSEPDANLGLLDAWNVFRVKITSDGWAKTWGGGQSDFSKGICVIDDGEIFVTGEYSGGVDFDPGFGVADPDANKWVDGGFLSCFNSEGEYQKSFTKTGSIRCAIVEVDGAGNILLGGRFTGTVDFDPGPGSFYLTALTVYDIFLWKLDPDFNLIWADSWSAHYVGYSGLWDMATDQYGFSYAAGRFTGAIDFDKGPGTDIHQGPGIFIICYDPLGCVVWLKIINASVINPNSLVCGSVENDNAIFIAGGFEGIVDFDPGPDTYELTSHGEFDAFLCSYSQDGDFISGISWGSIEDEETGCLNIDGSGNIWLVGTFNDDVDFDPGSGTDIYTSNGYADFFLSKFDADFNYLFCCTWGSEKNEELEGLKIVSDPSDTIYLCGNYKTSMDIDPGPDSEFVYGNGSSYNFFISKFDPTGNFLHVTALIGPDSHHCYDLDVDSNGNAFVCGNFCNYLDFDPGPGFDVHESFGNYDAFILRLNPDGTW